ncbi:entry exclusion protein TrbK [Rhizobium sp. Leaf386]|nr:entry exclusion protein TrbK [Rhizobium sp. Leaf386]
MVRTKAIVIAIFAVVAVGSTGVWFLISERQSGQERLERYFSTSKKFPTSGGQKLKPQW